MCISKSDCSHTYRVDIRGGVAVRVRLGDKENHKMGTQYKCIKCSHEKTIFD